MTKLTKIILALLLIVGIGAWHVKANQFKKTITERALAISQTNKNINFEKIAVNTYGFGVDFGKVTLSWGTPEYPLKLTIDSLTLKYSPLTATAMIKIGGDKFTINIGNDEIYSDNPNDYLELTGNVFTQIDGDVLNHARYISGAKEFVIKRGDQTYSALSFDKLDFTISKSKKNDNLILSHDIYCRDFYITNTVISNCFKAFLAIINRAPLNANLIAKIDQSIEEILQYSQPVTVNWNFKTTLNAKNLHDQITNSSTPTELFSFIANNTQDFKTSFSEKSDNFDLNFDLDFQKAMPRLNFNMDYAFGLSVEEIDAYNKSVLSLYKNISEALDKDSPLKSLFSELLRLEDMLNNKWLYPRILKTTIDYNKNNFIVSYEPDGEKVKISTSCDQNFALQNANIHITNAVDFFETLVDIAFTIVSRYEETDEINKQEELKAWLKILRPKISPILTLLSQENQSFSKEGILDLGIVYEGDVVKLNGKNIDVLIPELLNIMSAEKK